MQDRGPQSQKYGEALAAVRAGFCPHCDARLTASLGEHLARDCDKKLDSEQFTLDDDYGGVRR